MNLAPYVVGWAVLAAIVIFLAVYRKKLADKEDATLHTAGLDNTAATGELTIMNKKIETIERWGKSLTVVAILYGLGLAGAYFYQVWTSSW